MGDVMIIIKCCSLMASLIFSSAVITYWLTKSKYQDLLEDKERYCVHLGAKTRRGSPTPKGIGETYRA